MAELFTEKFHLLWALLLTLALFFPVRRLIFVLAIRRLQHQSGKPADSQNQARHWRRASMTAALLCFLVGYLYTSTWWG